MKIIRQTLAALMAGGLVIWLAWGILPPSGRVLLEAWMLNVGQGESVLVREAGGKLLLFDGGPDDSVLKELGAVLPPWSHHLDLVILSHPHSDHVQGLISVLNRYRVDEVWSSGTVIHTAVFRAWQASLAREHLKVTTVFAGKEARLGQARIRVYFPLTNMQGKEPKETHDGDVVVKITTGNASLLLAGDLNENHEANLLNACSLPTCSLRAEVLQIPHHGSKTGLSVPFLQAVHPQAALISLGMHNIFHFPNRDILRKLADNRVTVFRTDTEQRIHVVFQEDQLEISAQTGQDFTAVPVPSVPP